MFGATCTVLVCVVKSLNHPIKPPSPDLTYYPVYHILTGGNELQIGYADAQELSGSNLYIAAHRGGHKKHNGEADVKRGQRAFSSRHARTEMTVFLIAV